MQYLFLAIILYLFYQYLLKNKPGVKGSPNRKKQETVIDIEPEDYSVELVPLPYQKVSTFLDAKEKSFFQVLKQVLYSKDVCVFAKVRISEVLSVPNDVIERINYLNKIQAEHIDFLLCHKDNYSTLVAIELDDSTEDRSVSKKDDFINRAFEDAGLPLVRITARPVYSLEDLQRILYPYI